MNRLRVAAAALLCAGGVSAFGQGYRVDSRATTVQTNMPTGANAPVLAIPGASVLICTTSDCSTHANIYQDQALTVPAANPIVAGGATPTNLSGAWGFWGTPGTTVWYKTTTTQGTVYGPYPLTVGGVTTGGGLDSFTVGNLSSLYTASLGGSPTTAPALTFTPVNQAANTVLGNFTGSSGAPASSALIDCAGTNNALNYSFTSHTFTCRTISGTGSPGGGTTQVQVNSASTFAGYAGFTTDPTGNVSVNSLSTTDASGAGFGMLGAEGTCAAGVTGKDRFCFSALLHRPLVNPNNTGNVALVGIATPITAGHLAVAASNGYDLVDGGTPGSGTPGGSTTQVQVNSTGSFAGYAGLTTDATGNLSANSLTVTDASGSGFGLLGSEGTCAGGVAGKDRICFSSLTHRPMVNPNATGAVAVVGAASPLTSGHLAIAAANGYDVVDGGTNVATATALASTPSICSSGQAPRGILASGNATGCASIGGGPATVVYTSLLGLTPIAAITPGSSSTGASDSAPAINAALATGIQKLVVDGRYALGSVLLLKSNQEISCTPGSGFIELPLSNMVMFQNATAVSSPSSCQANVSNGLGGFVVSNLCQQNIKIDGCMLNYNSTQSVTNADHKTGPDNFWINGIRMLGVQGLTITRNEMYDAPTYSVAVDNLDTFDFSNNQILVPLPSGHPIIKNTDGLHVNGPATNGKINGNFGVTGDDFIALNANDGYDPATSDPNGPHVAYPGFVTGNITNVTVENNFFDGAYSGVRMLSIGALIDQIHVLHNFGTTWDIGMQMDSPYASGAGTPNFGCVDVDGWDVQRGTQTNSTYFATVYVNGNFDCLRLRNLNYRNAATAYPYFLQGPGTINNLQVSGFNVSNGSGTQNTTSLIQTNGILNNYAVNGITWQDGLANTGKLFGGTTVPSAITASNFSGPNRLLAAGYSPTAQNGDAFTNTAPTVTTYVNTVFNEAAAGTNLAGTTPTTCASGCVGPWVLASGTDYTYQTGGGAATTTPGSQFDLINAGTANGVLRLNMSTCTGSGMAGCQFAIRYVDINNFVAINAVVSGAGAPSVAILDVVAGVATQIAGPLNGTLTGNYTIQYSGASVTVTNSNGMISATTANTTGTKVGFTNFGTTIGMEIESLSVKSN